LHVPVGMPQYPLRHLRDSLVDRLLPVAQLGGALMSMDNLIEAWKDPDRRGADLGVEHPAGEITLFQSGGHAGAGLESLVTQPWNCDTAYTCTDCFVTCEW
jgi:hypothetical protein